MNVQVFIVLAATIIGLVAADGDHPHDHSAVPAADYSVPVPADYSAPAPAVDYSVPDTSVHTGGYQAASPAVSYGKSATGYGHGLVTAYDFVPEQKDYAKIAFKETKVDKVIDFYNQKIADLQAMKAKMSDKIYSMWSQKEAKKSSTGDSYTEDVGYDANKYVFLPLAYAKNKGYKGTKAAVKSYSPSVHVVDSYAAPVAVPVAAYDAPQPAYSAPAPQPAYSAPAPQPPYGVPAPQPAYGVPAPQPAYGIPAPQPEYSAPQPTYGAPAAQPIPKSSYGVPVADAYSAVVPEATYEAPAVVQPTVQYAAALPSVDYVAPAAAAVVTPVYKAPQPAASYNVPVAPVADYAAPVAVAAPVAQHVNKVQKAHPKVESTTPALLPIYANAS